MLFPAVLDLSIFLAADCLNWHSWWQHGDLRDFEGFHSFRMAYHPIANISKFLPLLYFCLCLTIQVHRNWDKIIFHSSILELQGILDYTLCKWGLHTMRYYHTKDLTEVKIISWWFSSKEAPDNEGSRVALSVKLGFISNLYWSRDNFIVAQWKNLGAQGAASCMNYFEPFWKCK